MTARPGHRLDPATGARRRTVPSSASSGNRASNLRTATISSAAADRARPDRSDRRAESPCPPDSSRLSTPRSSATSDRTRVANIGCRDIGRPHRHRSVLKIRKSSVPIVAFRRRCRPPTVGSWRKILPPTYRRALPCEAPRHLDHDQRGADRRVRIPATACSAAPRGSDITRFRCARKTVRRASVTPTTSTMCCTRRGCATSNPTSTNRSEPPPASTSTKSTASSASATPRVDDLSKLPWTTACVLRPPPACGGECQRYYFVRLGSLPQSHRRRRDRRTSGRASP